MKKQKQYNEWDVDERIHPGKFKAALRSKELSQKYRIPVYEYEALHKANYEYDEQQLHEVSWL